MSSSRGCHLAVRRTQKPRPASWFQTELPAPVMPPLSFRPLADAVLELFLINMALPLF